MDFLWTVFLSIRFTRRSSCEEQTPRIWPDLTEVAMNRFKAGRAAMLCCTVALAAASAESIQRDTAVQHHEWARKFAVDPDTTGSIGAPDRPGESVSQSPCVPAGLVFGRTPVEQWRIHAC
jgi:hypothetical protein